MAHGAYNDPRPRRRDLSFSFFFSGVLWHRDWNILTVSQMTKFIGLQWICNLNLKTSTFYLNYHWQSGFNGRGLGFWVYSTNIVRDITILRRYFTTNDKRGSPPEDRRRPRGTSHDRTLLLVKWVRPRKVGNTRSPRTNVRLLKEPPSVLSTENIKPYLGQPCSVESHTPVVLYKGRKPRYYEIWHKSHKSCSWYFTFRYLFPNRVKTWKPTSISLYCLIGLTFVNWTL